MSNSQRYQVTHIFILKVYLALRLFQLFLQSIEELQDDRKTGKFELLQTVILSLAVYILEFLFALLENTNYFSYLLY